MNGIFSADSTPTNEVEAHVSPSSTRTSAAAVERFSPSETRACPREGFAIELIPRATTSHERRHSAAVAVAVPDEA